MENEGDRLDEKAEKGNGSGSGSKEKSAELVKKCTAAMRAEMEERTDDMKAQLERLEREQKSQFETITQLLNRVLANQNKN